MKKSDGSVDEIKWKEKQNIGKTSLDVGGNREGDIKVDSSLEPTKADGIGSIHGK